MNIVQTVDTEITDLARVARQMDALFRLPGTRITVGLDNLLGLVPVVGDLLAVLPALWIIRRARLLGARPATLARMMFNTLLDAGIGSIPVAGDIFDMLYNANLRNVALLAEDLNDRTLAARAVQHPILAPAPLSLPAG